MSELNNIFIDKAKKMQENLEKTKNKDKIKTDYCLNNNINLLRIPYWDKDKIDEILDNELNKEK